MALDADPADEGAIDLDGVDLQAVQMTQRRVSRAEVVEAPFDAHRLRVTERHARSGHVMNEGALGDLQLQPRRLQSRSPPESSSSSPTSSVSANNLLETLTHITPGASGPNCRCQVTICRHDSVSVSRVIARMRPGVFGERNELARADQSPHGMAPAHERFEPGDSPGSQRHDRLIVHLERATLDRVPQLGFHLQASDRLLAHGGIEDFTRARCRRPSPD